MFVDFLLDLIIAAILVGFSFYGYKKGIFRLVVSSFKGLSCFVTSMFLCNNVADFIEIFRKVSIFIENIRQKYEI